MDGLFFISFFFNLKNLFTKLRLIPHLVQLRVRTALGQFMTFSDGSM